MGHDRGSRNPTSCAPPASRPVARHSPSPCGEMTYALSLGGIRRSIWIEKTQGCELTPLHQFLNIQAVLDAVPRSDGRELPPASRPPRIPPSTPEENSMTRVSVSLVVTWCLCFISSDYVCAETPE